MASRPPPGVLGDLRGIGGAHGIKQIRYGSTNTVASPEFPATHSPGRMEPSRQA